MHRSWKTMALILAISLGSLLAVASSLGAARVSAATTPVTIRSYSFTPDSVTVPVGTTVTWTNGATIAHTATSDTGAFDTGALGAGQSGSATFNTAGTFPYHCAIHPSMHGTVVVQQAGATTTATSTTAAATATTTATGAATAAATSTSVAAATNTPSASPTATKTGVPLAAYPAPLSSASAKHTGKSLVFRWSLIAQAGVRGFNLYAGMHRLNAHRIPTHRSLTYRATTPYKSGRPAIRVIFRNGRYTTIPIF